MTHMCLCHQAV